MNQVTLITGANGWIGRHVLETIHSYGAEVHAITSQTSFPSRYPHVCWHTVDLHDARAVHQLLEAVRPSHLLHLAWRVEHGHFWHAEENLQWTASTLALAQAFIRYGGHRFVGVGSCAEYAWGWQSYDEGTAQFTPHTLYGACKHALKGILETYCQLHHHSFAWAHLFHIFGPEEDRRRLVPQVILSLLKGTPLSCSQGTHYRDFIFIKDLARGLVQLLFSEVQGAVNLGTGVPITMQHLARTVGRMLGNEALLSFDRLSSEPEWVVASTTKRDALMHWEPTYTLEQALKETIGWWNNRLSLS